MAKPDDKNTIAAKSFAFALRVIKAYKYLTAQNEYVLSNYIDEQSYTSIYEDCVELIKLLTSIIKTTKDTTN